MQKILLLTISLQRRRSSPWRGEGTGIGPGIQKESPEGCASESSRDCSSVSRFRFDSIDNGGKTSHYNVERNKEGGGGIGKKEIKT